MFAVETGHVIGWLCRETQFHFKELMWPRIGMPTSGRCCTNQHVSLAVPTLWVTHGHSQVVNNKVLALTVLWSCYLTSFGEWFTTWRRIHFFIEVSGGTTFTRRRLSFVTPAPEKPAIQYFHLSTKDTADPPTRASAVLKFTGWHSRRQYYRNGTLKVSR